LDSAKDVDCMTPINIAKLFSGDSSGYAPCTPEAVIELLDFYGIDLKGKKVTLIGRSMVVGKPLAILLLQRHATVTICHTRTKDLPQTVQNADLVIAAAGKAKMIAADFITPGQIVIDVGINVDQDGNLCGDVDFEAVIGKSIANYTGTWRYRYRHYQLSCQTCCYGRPKNPLIINLVIYSYI